MSIGRADFGPYPVHVGPKTVPTNETIEINTSCEITEIEIVNDTDQTASISLYDRQDPPICLITPQNPLPPGATISAALRRYMPGGFTWQSDVDGVSGYVNAKIL